MEEESIEAKARCFQSLTLEERVAVVCQFTDIILPANPNVVKQKEALRNFGLL